MRMFAVTATAASPQYQYLTAPDLQNPNQNFQQNIQNVAQNDVNLNLAATQNAEDSYVYRAPVLRAVSDTPQIQG